MELEYISFLKLLLLLTFRSYGAELYLSFEAPTATNMSLLMELEYISILKLLLLLTFRSYGAELYLSLEVITEWGYKLFITFRIKKR